MNHINSASRPGNVHGLPHIPEDLNNQLPAMMQTLKNGVHRTLNFIQSNVSQQTFDKAQQAGVRICAVGYIPLIISSPVFTMLSPQIQAQLLLGPAVAGLVVGCGAALIAGTTEVTMAGAKLLVKPTFDYINKSMEATDPTALSQEEFQEALRSGNIPNAFQDPISYEIMDDPITFLEDPSKTAFERSSIEEWKKAGGENARHPMLSEPPLSQFTTANMPALKAQIVEFKAKWGHNKT